MSNAGQHSQISLRDFNHVLSFSLSRIFTKFSIRLLPTCITPANRDFPPFTFWERVWRHKSAISDDVRAANRRPTIRVLPKAPYWLTSGELLRSRQAFQITWTPLHLVFYRLFWGHVFFAFHNLGTFCRGELLKLVWISVAKIWSRSLIMLQGVNIFVAIKFGDIFLVLIWGHPVFLTLYNGVKNM
jgi:hypothetical protein